MSLRSDIEARFIEAMKAKDADKVSTYRMLRSALKNAEIDKQVKELSDDQVTEVIGKEVKKLKDSLADFEKAGRTELKEKTESELALLSGFLPEQLSEADVQAAVAQKAAALGLTGEAAYGRLMGEVMKDLKGRADGGTVGKAVKEFLQNK
ncbi:MAG TPA: GatB/YqeY domain-containing protein [Patescibacteria group bacterium]|nr:GatB/YqeY domain-containing protein [Patescibacteria group bacterium]